MDNQILIEKLIIKKILYANNEEINKFKFATKKEQQYINKIADSILENSEKRKLILDYKNPITNKELKSKIKQINSESKKIKENISTLETTKRSMLNDLYGKSYAVEMGSLSKYLGVEDYKDEGLILDYTKKQINFVFLIKNKNINNDQKLQVQRNLYKLCDMLPEKFRVIIGITPIEYKDYENQLYKEIQNPNLSDEQKQIKKYQWSLVNTWNTESLINERNTYIIINKQYNSLKAMETCYIDYHKYREVFELCSIELNRNVEDIFKGLQSIFKNNEVI